MYGGIFSVWGQTYNPGYVHVVNNKQCEMRVYLCRWSSTTELEIYKIPRVYLPPK